MDKEQIDIEAFKNQKFQVMLASISQYRLWHTLEIDEDLVISNHYDIEFLPKGEIIKRLSTLQAAIRSFNILVL